MKRLLEVFCAILTDAQRPPEPQQQKEHALPVYWERAKPIANTGAPFHANSQCMRIIRKLLTGEVLTTMGVIRLLNASSGGSRLRNVVGWMEANGVEVKKCWVTSAKTNKRHLVWSLGYQQRAQVRRLLGM